MWSNKVLSNIRQVTLYENQVAPAEGIINDRLTSKIESFLMACDLPALAFLSTSQLKLMYWAQLP